MLQIPTEEELFERLVSHHLEIAGPMDVSEGSISYDFLKPYSLELAEAYRYNLALWYALSIDYAEDENLDLAVGVSGITRKTAVKARTPGADLKLTGSTGQQFIKGIRFMTEGATPLFFVLKETVIADSVGVAFGILEAEAAGIAGEIPAGTKLLPVGTVVGLKQIELLSPLQGGADRESDDDLRERCRQKRRRQATSGNGAHYLEWALEVSGVRSARVFENQDGPNTVRVVLLGQDGQPPDAATVDKARAHILSKRPLGPGDDGIFVVPATPLFVDIAAAVKLSQSSTAVDAKTEYEPLVVDYFQDLMDDETITQSAGSVEIVIAKVEALLFSVRGVKDCTGLTLNGIATNLPINPNEIPVLRGVSLEVVV